MTNQIDLNSFSAKKYKSELYQLRLNSYLEKSEDFEESDFIESEQKYFNSCYNSVDEDYYNSQRIHWYDLEGEMDYDIYYDLEPQIDGETYQYFSNNRNEQERLIKTFSLILQFLSGTEKSQVKDMPKPPQFEPAMIEEVKTQTKPIKPKKEFKDFFNPDVKIETIENIQKEFEEYDNKKMAYLIYLLHKEFDLINYSVKSRDMSRKHFVESLLNKEIVMQGINKYFQTNDVELCINGYHKDNDYISTKEKLSKTIV